MHADVVTCVWVYITLYTYYMCVGGQLGEMEPHFTLHSLSCKVARLHISLEQQQLVGYLPRVHLRTACIRHRRRCALFRTIHRKWVRTEPCSCVSQSEACSFSCVSSFRNSASRAFSTTSNEGSSIDCSTPAPQHTKLWEDYGGLQAFQIQYTETQRCNHARVSVEFDTANYQKQ